MDIRELHAGDEVRWTDPDGGRTSRTYRISSIEVIGDVVRITDITGDELECFENELS